MYKRELQQTARKSLFLKLLHLPYGILIPILISTEVTNALAGKTKSVLTTAAGILAIVFCYTYFYGRLEIAFRKEKEQAVQACKMKQYRTIFANSFEKLYHSGLGKNLENMKNDFNAVTELMTEHRPMFAASLAEAVLFGGYLCWKNPLVGICLILISLLQVIPPLLVKKYIQVNYDNCREIEGKITDYTVSAFQGFMTIKLYQLKDWWLSHLEELFQAYIKNWKQLDLCQPFGSRYVCGFGSRPEIRNLLPDRRFRPVRKNQPRNRHPGDCAVRQHICCGQKRVRNLSAVCGKQPRTKTPGGVGECKCPERSVTHPHGNRMARSFLFLR